ncbi:MAG: DUF5683 domain-containing protein [Bacteroidota bacterium]
MHKTALLLFFSFSLHFCTAQNDSLAIAIDSLEQKQERVIKPAAALRWALIPGGGQVYNRRWWKLPLIYGGLFGTIGVADFYQTNYRRFVNALEAECFGDDIPDGCVAQDHEFTGIYDVNALRTVRDRLDQRRQYSYLYILGVYLLQAFEAYTDAQLMDFDIEDDLSVFRLQPNLLPSEGLGMGVVIPLGAGLRERRQEAILATKRK